MFVAQRDVKSEGVSSATKIISFTTVTIGTADRQKEIDVATDGSRIVYHITGFTDPHQSDLISNKSVTSFTKLIENETTKVVADKIFDETKKKVLTKILEKVAFKECDSHDTLSDDKCRCTVTGLIHIYQLLLGDAFETYKKASLLVIYIRYHTYIFERGFVSIGNRIDLEPNCDIHIS